MHDFENKRNLFRHKNQQKYGNHNICIFVVINDVTSYLFRSDRHNLLLNGLYSMFLMYWYKFFDPSQMLILDGPDEKFQNHSQINLQY